VTISRRKFVNAAILAATFAAAPVKTVLGQSWKERDGNPGEQPPVQTDPLANYSKSAFVSYLNSIFQIETVAGVVAVTLAKVDDMPSPKGGECFSLLFRGGRAQIKQDTYTVMHPALGTFQLFLVPAGSDQNGAREYLATINRLSPADLANMSAPLRIAVGSRSSSAPASNSTANSTGNTSTQVTAPSNAQTNVAPAATTVAPQLSAPIHQRKRKPVRKRVDDKSSVIN
jgi:hypothetical protein